MIIFILLTATLRVSITLHIVLRRNSIVRLKLLLFLGEGVWGGLMFLHFITVVGFGGVEDDISDSIFVVVKLVLPLVNFLLKRL